MQKEKEKIFREIIKALIEKTIVIRDIILCKHLDDT